MARTAIPIEVIAGGQPLSGVNVTVNLRAGGTATVFGAETGAGTVANPLTTNAAGMVSGWLDRGRYNLVVNDPSGRVASFTEPFDSSSADDITSALFDRGLQAGVIAAGDLAVTSSANLVLPVAAGSAYIASSSGFLAPYTFAGGTATIGANASGNPRLDQVVFDGTTVSVLAGTATAGATLDNRTGAAALPVGYLRLADVLVADGATALASSVIRDRRPWARGAFASSVRAATQSISSATDTLLDALLEVRIECTGNPMRVTYRTASYGQGSTAASRLQLRIAVDGANGGGGTTMVTWDENENPADTWHPIYYQAMTAPAAGSHRFGIYAAVQGGGNWNLGLNQTIEVEEITRPNSANNATSG